MDQSRHNPRRRHLVMTAAALSCLAVARPVLAQGVFPDKPIRMIVGFPPGTATDTVARLIAQYLADAKGWTIVVENRPGVAGTLGATEVARAAPDGHTLLMSAAGPLATAPNLYKSVTYDSARDFTPLALVADISYVIAVGAASPAKSIKDLIALGKAKPGGLNYGSVGDGSTQHLIGSTFLTRAGVQMVHVPYRGSVELLAGTVSGDLAFYADTAVAVAPQIAAGRLRGLGITSARRVSNLPELATLDQQGMTGFDMPNWLVLVGPAKMPAPVVETLNREVNGLLRNEDVRARLTQLGTEPRGGMSSDELRAFIRAELVKWKQALDASGAKTQ